MTSLNQSFDPALIDFVDEFREAAGNLTTSSITRFPAGACNWASEILGQLLYERGFGTWQLVKGSGLLKCLKSEIDGEEDAVAEMFGESMPEIERHSHDWLEKDGIHIDPTADQFKNREEFIGQKLPFIHRGDSPLSAFITINEEGNSRRNVLTEGIHHTAESMHREIRAKLGM